MGILGRGLVFASAAAIYGAVFVALYPVAGPGIAALATLPVVMIGWLFGVWGGLAAAVGWTVLNTLFLNLQGEVGWNSVISAGGGAGTMALLVIGVLTGYMSRLNARVSRQARELEHRATHDFLTDLPNRALFYRRLEEALSRGPAAVLFLDLDDFKLINDSLGHETGDRLLVRVAERVRGSVRQGETVSRLGGDEFTILVEDVSEPDWAEEVASRILESLREPFEIDGRELRVTGSVGVSVGSPGLQSPESLLGAADSAMYDAKARGKAGYRVSVEE